jgi:hypothetical protein
LRFAALDRVSQQVEAQEKSFRVPSEVEKILKLLSDPQKSEEAADAQIRQESRGDEIIKGQSRDIKRERNKRRGKRRLALFPIWSQEEVMEKGGIVEKAENLWLAWHMVLPLVQEIIKAGSSGKVDWNKLSQRAEGWAEDAAQHFVRMHFRVYKRMDGILELVNPGEQDKLELLELGRKITSSFLKAFMVELKEHCQLGIDLLWIDMMKWIEDSLKEADEMHIQYNVGMRVKKQRGEKEGREEPKESQAEQEELERLVRKIQGMAGSRNEGIERNAVVLDVRDGDGKRQELLKLAGVAYEEYRKNFSSQETVLAFVGSEEEIEKFMKESGMEAQICGDDPEEILKELEGYSVKVFSGRKEEWPGDVLFILLDTRLSAESIHEMSETMVKTFQLFLIQQ